MQCLWNDLCGMASSMCAGLPAGQSCVDADKVCLVVFPFSFFFFCGAEDLIQDVPSSVQPLSCVISLTLLLFFVLRQGLATLLRLALNSLSTSPGWL